MHLNKFMNMALFDNNWKVPGQILAGEIQFSPQK